MHGAECCDGRLVGRGKLLRLRHVGLHKLKHLPGQRANADLAGKRALMFTLLSMRSCPVAAVDVCLQELSALAVHINSHGLHNNNTIV